MTTRQITLESEDLFDVYSLLSDATEAASTGDPNTCAAKAAEAKRLVADLYEQGRSE